MGQRHDRVSSMGKDAEHMTEEQSARKKDEETNR